MARLLIIGASELATLIAHHATLLGWEIAGFIDNRAAVGTAVIPYGTVLGGIDEIDGLFEGGVFDALSVGVGYTQFAYRREAFSRFKARVPFANIIHVSAEIDSECVLGEGLVVLARCTVDVGAELGDNVLLNVGAVVAHHSAVGAHSFVGPAATIAGKVRVGQGCFIGVNATVIDNIVLCDGARVGGGATVTRNIVGTQWHVGTPARVKSDVMAPVVL